MLGTVRRRQHRKSAVKLTAAEVEGGRIMRQYRN